MSVAKRPVVIAWFEEVDAILRGTSTRVESLQEGRLRISSFRLFAVNVVLAAVSGFCMGSYALFNNPDTFSAVLQMISSGLKLPFLFYLTMLITVPSLYVFNALIDSKLDPLAIWRLISFSLFILLAVLAAFGPIVAFFSVFSESHPFVVLLNVTIFTLAGGIGLGKLLQVLERLHWARLDSRQESVTEPGWEVDASAETPDPGSVVPPESPEISASSGPPLLPAEVRREQGRVRLIFRCWVIVFALVGAQMAWILRPFIGNPNLPFTPFRERGSNFFEAVYGLVVDLLF